MAKMNFDAYRFSISWPRIFPNGVGEVNWEGVAYYDRLINYLLKKGVTPYVNLHHYDTPEVLEKQFKGFLSRQIVDAYVNFADFCFKIFDDRVKNWVTFNEPGIVALYGYDPGTAAPGRCSHPYGNCREGDSTKGALYCCTQFHFMSCSRGPTISQEVSSSCIPLCMENILNPCKSWLGRGYQSFLQVKSTW
ncbi:Beta-glucosidase 44 [Acorus calamus]|uniref:Beta-glucosidase 44 n=1 Tax=Acorus calamus TaxID=4465 RepID=A0AAV9FN87_ACOCL|nr:Beta-glucosidase 44 [Acorus calamus]